MNYTYLYKDGTNTPYTEERLRGIAHEMYCLECTSKGVPYCTGRTTVYNANIISHPLTGDKALQIDIDQALQYVPSIFAPRLVSYATMEADGWFNLPQQ